jgi:PmbA protein
MNDNADSLLCIAREVVREARARGADIAEVSAAQGWELSAQVRLGEVEFVQEAGQRGLSLRVLRDNHVAASSTSDLRPEGLARCVQNAIELLDLSEPDPDARPAETSDMCQNPNADLHLFDPELEALGTEEAISMALAAETAALRCDERLRLSEGASFGRASGISVMVFSNGFEGVRRGTRASIVASPVAEDTGGKRRRGHYYTAHRYARELESAESVGRKAAERTIAQLGSRSVATCEAPVIFHPDAARSIIGTFADCVLGGSLWRKSSYLVDKLGTQVASPEVHLVDDPLRPQGFGSRVFDGEGLACKVNPIVQAGTYVSPLLDSTSARKLGLKSTASASRHGAYLSASISNLVMQPGAFDPDSIIANTSRGLFVTGMLGFGFNPVTGDFSRGAVGFWIENGRFAFPVSEVTISSNLDSMLKNIDAIGNDQVVLSSVIAPTFRVASMTIAGQ